MKTEVLAVDARDPDPAAVRRAAGVLQGGGLVAFPTETVYGLGADGLDCEAVARIFAAKGRPATNPLILHVTGAAQSRELVADWPAAAAALAERFWPGPLTIVLPKRSIVPDAATAGGPTVAVRCPAHPVAMALMRAAGVPVAAPSANRSTRLSPTCAEHVLRGLGGRIEMVLDAGPTSGGIESTVLDLASDAPRLLRPGIVSTAEIEAVIGPVQRGPAGAGVPLRSPGMLRRHYAPRTPLECVDSEEQAAVAAARDGGRVVLLTLGGAPQVPGSPTVVAMPQTPHAYAARLYATLHALDDGGYDRIMVVLPPETEDWLAVRDRLRRAAADP